MEGLDRFSAALVMALASSHGAAAAAAACSVQSQPFGALSTGEQVTAYTVRNAQLEATILNYGGIIHAIKAPDRDGKVANVVRTLEKLSDYEANGTFSKIVGRFAGRIGNGGFTLDGKRHELVSRPDGVSAHGGPKGFGSRVWASLPAECGVDLSLSSPDEENGYPGNVQVTAAFRLDGADLRIEYRATTDKPTVLNLTHHAFFNLSDGPDVYGHILQVHADQWLRTDDKRVPTGEIAGVSGVMDLRAGRALGPVVTSSEDVIVANKGLDHTFVLKGRHAATLSDPVSGRTLDVFTSEPGLVVFSANGWNGTLKDGQGRPLVKGGGLALETQHFPNSPNIPAFPTTIISPQAPLYSTTTFRFGRKWNL